jgi:phosphoglycolate phosphatase
MLQDIRAYIFDFDGTLAIPTIDFSLMRRQVDQLIARYGLDPTLFSHLYILEMIDAAAAHLDRHGGSSGTRLQREAEQAIIAIEAASAGMGGMLPGAIEVLQTLRQRGFKVGIVTRNCALAVRTICDMIDDVCDVFLPREAVRFVKPHPEHLERALAVLQVSPSAAVMIGDGPIDISAGKALGMKTVAVLTGGARREALLASQPDLLLDSVADLMAWLPQPASPPA